MAAVMTGMTPVPEWGFAESWWQKRIRHLETLYGPAFARWRRVDEMLPRVHQVLAGFPWRDRNGIRLEDDGELALGAVVMGLAGASMSDGYASSIMPASLERTYIELERLIGTTEAIRVMADRWPQLFADSSVANGPSAMGDSLLASMSPSRSAGSMGGGRSLPVGSVWQYGLASDMEQVAEHCEESPRAQIRDFVRANGGRDRPVFVFASSGLLNILRLNLSLLPSEMNMLVIGSSWTVGEVAWARRHVSFPFVNLPLRVDDRSVWEFIVEACQTDFAWLDIDCFAFGAGMFEDLWKLPWKCMVAGAFGAAGMFEFAATPLVAWSGDALSAIQRSVPTSPSMYAERPAFAGRFASYACTRQLTAEHRHLIERALHGIRIDRVVHQAVLDVYRGGFVAPSTMRGHYIDALGRPEHQLLDTLLALQLVGQALGWDLRIADESVTKDVWHASGISFHRFFRPQIAHGFGAIGEALASSMAMTLALDLASLCVLAGELPPTYRTMRGRLMATAGRLRDFGARRLMTLWHRRGLLAGIGALPYPWGEVQRTVRLWAERSGEGRY